MAKEIQYPTDEWIDSYIEAHEDSTIASAEQAWWDKQIDKGNPTPFDLTPEQKKASKEMLKESKSKKPTSYSLEGKPKRVRKADDEKRLLMSSLVELLANVDNLAEVALVNPEKEISFKIGENSYSISLIKHRPPKG